MFRILARKTGIYRRRQRQSPPEKHNQIVSKRQQKRQQFSWLAHTQYPSHAIHDVRLPSLEHVHDITHFPKPLGNRLQLENGVVRWVRDRGSTCFGRSHTNRCARKPVAINKELGAILFLAKFGDARLVSLDEVMLHDGSTTRGNTVSRGLWD